ncbi:hypothetical protein HOLleu_36090 [Holothuria leucospilota]|uniref:Uncharacterized protein n=1 Tax=Holothuria leucospilota TaxID=206669 RepID=A0A9Q0YLG0_HOLLE|nr:hypothetical protein HOLleu_36090 [Holothuria leucospilota]
MYPSCQPQVVWGNQQYSTVTQGPSSNGSLWGSNIRRIMGILQIVSGLIGFAFGVAVICVPLRYFDHVDYAGWGLWNGMFATVTGFLGVYSKKKKGMVISYMVTCIIASVMAAACCYYAFVGAANSTVYYYTPLAQAQQCGPAPPYALVAGQQFSAPQNVQGTTPNNQPQQFVPAPVAPLVAAQQFNAPQST